MTLFCKGQAIHDVRERYRAIGSHVTPDTARESVRSWSANMSGARLIHLVAFDRMVAFLHSGELHAPFVIFFRGAKLITDEEILDRLRLRGYRGTELQEKAAWEPWVIIGELSGYTIVADDWYYTLWHAERNYGVVSEFAQNTSELFCYRLPDVDDSFDFDYFRNGKLERSYHLEPDGWINPPVLTTTGTPLPFEAFDLDADDPMERPRNVAARLGFDMTGSDCGFRRYAGQAKPQP